MKWRKWNNIIHRDLGYLCVGLTLIYALSGLAVNHMSDWNPNYDISEQTSTIKPITENTDDDDYLTRSILNQMHIDEPVNNTYRPDEERIDIFLENHTVSANFVTGEVTEEIINHRPVLRQVNFLHINEPKKLWTWLADLYAISLAILAITGLFVIKGTKGLAGRGKWLTGIGFIIPLFFLWLYF